MQVYKNITIKQDPSDFVVTEVPCSPELMVSNPRGQSYTVLKLVKQGLTTLECLRILGKHLGLASNQVQCLGLKDEDGITEQLVSVEAILAKPDLNNLSLELSSKSPQTVASLQIYGYSSVGLKVKRLHGNIFRVRLRGLTQAESEALHESIAEQPAHHFINYYDQQRFGLPGGPFVSHQLGKSIVDNDYDGIRRYYQQSGNAKIDQIDETTTGQKLLELIDYKKLDFFVSAYTSYLWNNAVSDNIAKHERTSPQPFEIFQGYNLFATAESVDVTPSDVPGYRFTSDRVLESYSKTRFVYISTNIFVDQPERINGQYSLDLQFFLPMGCYATMAIKQLLATRLGGF